MRARPVGLVRAALVLVLAVAVVLAVGHDGQIGSERRVAMRRADRLQHGVNLSGWFAQGSADSAHLQTAITADDLQRIKRMGFDHVRLPVDPLILAPGGRLDAPDPDVLYYLEDAVRVILDNGLSVLVDLHPPARWGKRLETDPASVDGVAALWGVLARRLGAYDPERVLFEVLNEPGVGDPAAWMAIQQRLAASIRSAAPRHTIIATGPVWSAIANLEQIQPLQDANVIYAFHLYEPFAFTHQGADWDDQTPVQALHAVPYPFDAAALAALLPTISDQKAREVLSAYAGEHWDAARIDALVARAAGWRDRTGAPIICTEFGVYRPVSATAARFAWLRDVRAALERHRIGWAIWEYAGGFGVVNGPPGRRVIDAPTARALFEE